MRARKAFATIIGNLVTFLLNLVTNLKQEINALNNRKCVALVKGGTGGVFSYTVGVILS